MKNPLTTTAKFSDDNFSDDLREWENIYIIREKTQELQQQR